MSTRPAGATSIHVNDAILENKRHGTNLPPIEVMRPDGSRELFHEVEILGPARVVYHRDDPLPDTNWTLWIETQAEVKGTRL